MNGLDPHWESYGSGGTPLIVLHGGYGMTSTMSEVTAAFATDRRVIAVDLQGRSDGRELPGADGQDGRPAGRRL